VSLFCPARDLERFAADAPKTVVKRVASVQRQGQRDALSLPSTLLLRKGLRLTVGESGDGRGMGAAWVSE